MANRTTGKAKIEAGRKGGSKKKPMTPAMLEQRRNAAKKAGRPKGENPTYMALAKRRSRLKKKSENKS